MNEPLKSINVVNPKSELAYGFSLFRYLADARFKEDRYLTKDRVYHITETERDTLDSVNQILDCEITTMVRGISIIGKLMAVSDNGAIDTEEIWGLGWFLRSTGQLIHDHIGTGSKVSGVCMLHPHLPAGV